jgi:hypothetical protein
MAFVVVVADRFEDIVANAASPTRPESTITQSIETYHLE